MRKTNRAVIVSVIAAMLLVPAGVAIAGGVEVEVKGACHPRGRWELSLDKEGGRIEVDFEVTAAAGQRWHVVMRHNGVKIFDGSRITRLDDDDRPDFEIERWVDDRVGWDRFKARAVNTSTGAVCKAKARI